MIAKPHIAKWQEFAPWTEFAQVEQDLIISRTLVELFSDDFLKEHLAFRGGTALHKLYLNPAARYSEDIDLVQIKPGPIKSIIERIAKVLEFFQEQRTTENKGHGIKAIYWFTSEYEEIKMRLKLEINCKEHFNVLGWSDFPFQVDNSWFVGKCYIRTYNINELLATKLRALYQRSKGRDLFDLYYSSKAMDVDEAVILQCYFQFMGLGSKLKIPGKKLFLKNVEAKINDPNFIGDMEGILRTNIKYDPSEAFNWLKSHLIEKM